MKPTWGNAISSPSRTQAAPSASFVHHGASATLRTNQPSVTGVSPASRGSRRARSTMRRQAAGRTAALSAPASER